MVLINKPELQASSNPGEYSLQSSAKIIVLVHQQNQQITETAL